MCEMINSFPAFLILLSPFLSLIGKKRKPTLIQSKNNISVIMIITFTNLLTTCNYSCRKHLTCVPFCNNFGCVWSSSGRTQPDSTYPTCIRGSSGFRARCNVSRLFPSILNIPQQMPAPLAWILQTEARYVVDV